MSFLRDDYDVLFTEKTYNTDNSPRKICTSFSRTIIFLKSRENKSYMMNIDYMLNLPEIYSSYINIFAVQIS